MSIYTIICSNISCNSIFALKYIQFSPSSLLLDDVTDSFTVLHSLGLAPGQSVYHQMGLQSEMEFLLCSLLFT